MPLRVPADTPPGPQEIVGRIGYQTCTRSRCDVPTGAEFRATVTVGQDPSAGSVPLTFTALKYAEVAKTAADSSLRLDPRRPHRALRPRAAGWIWTNSTPTPPRDANAPMAIILLTAFAAGFILNFMPCVLPVIGLKVMSFVQQSGDSRGRIFMLNFWYTLGIMAVFLVLATLAVLPSVGMGWGEQFSSVTFNVVLSSVVFAFALSFLGFGRYRFPGSSDRGTCSRWPIGKDRPALLRKAF